MPTHDEKIRAIAAQVRALPRDGAPATFAKKTVSHFVPNPFVAGPKVPPIDLRPLDEILEIDVAGRRCVAESGVSFADLARATLAKGLMPYTVPELKGITIGGAVSGCSVESLSYRRGGFHDSCLEYEVVTGTGEVLTCSREQDPALFEMVHGGYGTLGILTKLTFSLLPARPFVQMDYQHFTDFAPYWAALQEQCASGDDETFLDGIIHGPRHFVICRGRLVDEAPFLSRYDWLEIYYKSTATRQEDYLTTHDYFFRYDAECHWISRTVPGLETRAGRLLMGKLLLGSENMIRWSKRLTPLFRLQRRPDVVVDVFIPSPRFPEFFTWYAERFDFWPLWIVPYKLPGFYPWIHKEHQARMGDTFVIDCAVYGKPNSEPEVDYSELMEKKVLELGGIKTLISRNHYDRETFWSIYDQPGWAAVKARTDPDNLFGELYERMHPPER